MDESQNEGPVAVEVAASAAETAEAIAESPAAEQPNLRLADRFKHIDDYRVDTRNCATALTAALQDVGADLMEVEAHMAEAFRDAVQAEPLTIESLELYSPPIDLLIRLTKQIAQVSQLGMRSAKQDR